MPATRQVQIGERTITVRELTFAEVRDWMTSVDAGETVDALHTLAFEDCGLDDIARMIDVPARDLEDCTPSELEELVAACKKLNPHFFRGRAMLSGVALAMIKEGEARASTARPASS